MRYLECKNCGQKAIFIKDGVEITMGRPIRNNDFLHINGDQVHVFESCACDNCNEIFQGDNFNFEFIKEEKNGKVHNTFY